MDVKHHVYLLPKHYWCTLLIIAGALSQNQPMYFGKPCRSHFPYIAGVLSLILPVYSHKHCQSTFLNASSVLWQTLPIYFPHTLLAYSRKYCRYTLLNSSGVLHYLCTLPNTSGVLRQTLPAHLTTLNLSTTPWRCQNTQHVISCGETSPTPGNHNDDDIFASTSTVSYSGSEIPKYNSWMLYQCPVLSSSGLKTGWLLIEGLLQPS